MGNAPGTTWTSSFKFPHHILLKIEWEILLELPGQLPVYLFLKSVLKVDGISSCNFCTNPIRLPHQILIRNVWKMILELLGQFHYSHLWNLHYKNGKCSCDFLCQLLQASFLASYWKSVETVVELSGPSPLHFFIRQAEVNGKCPWSFLGKSSQVSLLNP